MQRPLTLHASALTDPEYTLYTTALLDLAGEDAASHPHDDSYYAALVVSARETRAWVRGRYTELAPARVDAVLKLFTPNIAPADTLSGGQFFAALRLVTHIRHGRPLDGSLVFVQAHPDDAASPPLQNSSPSSVEQVTTNDSPAHSRNTSREGHLIDDSPSPSVPPALPPKPTLPPTPSSSTNPFINRTKTQESIATVSSATTATPIGTLRAKSTPAPILQPQPVIPPLPPRKSAPAPPEDKSKPPPPPPPRHATGNLTQGGGSPFAFWHNQSTVQSPNTLIQQSLQAGRIAQSLKKADQKLEKERVMQVLKSSAPSGSKDAGKDKRTRSESPSKGIAALTISPPGPSAIARSYSVSSGSDTSSVDAPKSLRDSAAQSAGTRAAGCDRVGRVRCSWLRGDGEGSAWLTTRLRSVTAVSLMRTSFALTSLSRCWLRDRQDLTRSDSLLLTDDRRLGLVSLWRL
ncbi:hypothetical protein PsYK624_150800 [Phanerochaete sordida]|uniref:Uncharacterized protein n=1 Tax=Phanerochaete sordida TaxID=48140 RepID=A0A9P3GPR5_9APHY|nr:hypothetical protein PsYK624_150800 [Phanerochaete sordida]